MMPWAKLRTHRDIIIFCLGGLLFLFVLKSHQQKSLPPFTIIPPPVEVHDEPCRTKAMSISEFIQETLNYDDPRLIQHLRDKVILPPSSQPYNLNDSEAETQYTTSGVEDFFKVMFQEKKGRIFIEAGAGDGEAESTSLLLEKDFGWTGLLVEADPYYYDKLVQKNRKAYFAPVCLSPLTSPEPLEFRVFRVAHHQSHLPLRGINPNKIWMCPSAEHKDRLMAVVNMPDDEAKNQKCKLPQKTSVKMVCLPLMSLMLAMNYTSVDLLSISIVGSELHVLTTLPFHNLNIKMLLVGKDSFTSPETIIALMKIRGFNRVRRIGRYLLSEEIPNHFLFLNQNYTKFPLP